ncbi:expressed protein, partial [Phakopsora pachyrhizi]
EKLFYQIIPAFWVTVGACFHYFLQGCLIGLQTLTLGLTHGLRALKNYKTQKTQILLDQTKTRQLKNACEVDSRLDLNLQLFMVAGPLLELHHH